MRMIWPGHHLVYRCSSGSSAFRRGTSGASSLRQIQVTCAGIWSAKDPAPAGVPPLPVAETSSGCQCLPARKREEPLEMKFESKLTYLALWSDRGDPTAKCALQGQPFTWCRVGSEQALCFALTHVTLELG